MGEDRADRALRLITVLVVLVGALCVAVALASFSHPEYAVRAGILGGLVTVAAFCEVRNAVRSQHVITPTSAALLVTIALLPLQWAVVAATGGRALAAVLRKQPPLKALFNTAKDTAGVALAGIAFHTISEAQLTHSLDEVAWVPLLAGLVVAALVYTAVDLAASTPVIALATRTPWRRVIARNAYLDATVRPINLLIAVATVTLHAVDPRMLAATPLAVVVVYLTNRQRIHAQHERQTWQRLADATDALSRVGVDKVIQTAVTGAASLFPDLQIEVEHHRNGRSGLVRVTDGRIVFDGDPADAPPCTGHERAYPLVLDDDSGSGTLRLRYRVELRLSDREEHMLTTFVAGLSTAIRNACAYEQATRLAEQHSHDATHDALTDLPNRRQLHERTRAALAQRPRRGVVALALLDLNHFKEVNDTLGHGAGDRVLIEVADRLRRSSHGAFVARLGGDEFAVLYTGLGAPAVASHRLRDLLSGLREPMDLDGVLINLETSAGLAIAGDGTDPDELLRRADVAMYQAKNSSREVSVYAHASDSADLGRLALAGELPRAVEDREFTVGFQPIVDLATGRVVAAEALARWEHPDLGNLPPSAFLGLVERSGLLAPFTEAVLGKALAAVAQWHAAGFPVQVAVNISPRSLADPKLAGMVLQAVETAGVTPHHLVLELTETTVMGHLDTVRRGIDTLRGEGVAVALDDFGTGQSSMAAVLQFPVDQLKVDRTWVAELGTSPPARALVSATVELARQLDIAVIAEGVERPAQREMLWELGCTAGQGSLFGWPPQAGDRLLQLLQRGYNGTPGALAAQLHPEATVVRLPRQGSRVARQ